MADVMEEKMMPSIATIGLVAVAIIVVVTVTLIIRSIRNRDNR